MTWEASSSSIVREKYPLALYPQFTVRPVTFCGLFAYALAMGIVLPAVMSPAAGTPSNLSALADMYLECCAAENKAEATITDYEDVIGAFCRFLRGNKCADTLDSFTLRIARNYVLWLRQRTCLNGRRLPDGSPKPLSIVSIGDHCRTLKAFSSWLYREGYTVENRLLLLKIPRAPTALIEILSPEETNAIIAYIDRATPTGNRDFALFMMIYDTGVRVSEIPRIDMTGLNLAQGLVKIMGKGARERVVPFGQQVSAILSDYIVRVRPLLGRGKSPYLFLAKDGSRLTVNAVKLIFKRLAKHSGVLRLHPHLCRHTFATNYLLNGEDIFSLREILGHTTFEMVNRYLHFTNSQISAQHRRFSPADRLRQPGPSGTRLK